MENGCIFIALYPKNCIISPHSPIHTHSHTNGSLTIGTTWGTVSSPRWLRHVERRSRGLKRQTCDQSTSWATAAPFCIPTLEWCFEEWVEVSFVSHALFARTWGHTCMFTSLQVTWYTFLATADGCNAKCVLHGSHKRLKRRRQTAQTRQREPCQLEKVKPICQIAQCDSKLNWHFPQWWAISIKYETTWSPSISLLTLTIKCQ